MSDYLNNLVARTLHLEPVVQPRLASLFEPLSAMTGLEAPTASQFESAPGVSTATEPATEVSQTRLPAQIIQQPQPFAVAIPHSHAHERETNAASDIPKETANVQPPPTFLPTQIIPPAASFEPNTNIQRIRGDEQVTSHSANTVSENSSIEKSNHQNRRTINPAVRRRATPQDREQNHAPSIADRHSIVTYLPPEQASSARKISAQASQAAEAPETVLVTIGRVNVRAIYAPPTPPPRSNRIQNQAMSLDEYLKQRSEGHR